MQYNYYDDEITVVTTTIYTIHQGFATTLAHTISSIEWTKKHVPNCDSWTQAGGCVPERDTEWELKNSL